MIIKNADVYTEEGNFVRKNIYIEGSIFANQNDKRACLDCGSDVDANTNAVKLHDEPEIDATDCYAIPALTDIHFHGCAGYDFCDGSREAIAAMAEYEASVGVANIVPATMTLSEEALTNICEAAKAYKNESRHEKRARLCGINMEGPFISFSKKGAQNKDFIKTPDILMFDKLNGASGNMIRLVSIAPELDGAMEFIEKKHGEVIVSLAHTDADYDTSVRAFEKGANHVTHLYNAMNPYTHRAPGPIGAAADADGVDVELICDGVHIHPAVVRATFKMFGDERIIFISDSMRAAGLEDGNYTLGGQEVEVVGNLATLKDGTIAGSVTNLMDCLRTAVLKMGIPLEKAVKCAAVNPAKCIGIYDKCGSITVGKYADLLLLKKDNLETVNVIMDGIVL